MLLALYIYLIYFWNTNEQQTVNTEIFERGKTGENSEFGEIVTVYQATWISITVQYVSDGKHWQQKV